MKTLLFSAAIISASIFTSCNNETLISESAPETNSALSLNVSELAYTPTATGSRAVTNTDAVKTTEFEEGDALGLFIISEDETITKQNVKFTYTSGIWTPDGVVNYYANSNYIAYFPYEENLTVESSSDIETGIKTYFTENNFTSTDQSSKEAYQKADLMMAKLEKPESPAISFPLKHQFSMVEISIPVRKYITTKTYDEAGTKFEYCAPHKVTWNTLTYNDNGITPYYAGNGVYRYIAVSATEAADVTISITGNVVYDENGNIMNFDNETNKNVSLSSGSYVSFNLKNPAIPSDVTERDLEVGDYYYSDGSIYPYGKQNDGNDLSSPLTEGCIGVIYDAENGVSETEWNHASVISIVSAGDNKWGNWDSGNYKDSGNLFLISEDGYYISNECSKKDNNSACYTAIKLNSQYSAPYKISSGWYLPSAWQLLMFMKGFGVSIDSDEFDAFGGNNRGNKNAAITNFDIAKNIILGEGTSTIAGVMWWTSSEVSDTQAWAIEWKTSQIRFLGRPRSESRQVRPVLSF